MNYSELNELFDRLWPICRSITGPGISESLEIMQDYIPLKIKKIPTGSEVFDWVVPQEWELERAILKTEDGEIILDTDISNLHVLNFSEPFSGVISFNELDKHLYSDPNFPEGGLLTQWLENQEIGSLIDFTGPLGRFNYYGNGYFKLG